MLSDVEITNKISARLKELRLKQNISRQDLAMSSGVSLSSIVRMEDEIGRAAWRCRSRPTAYS